MKKIIVLGANGFIGKNLLAKLVETSHEIYAFDIQEPQDKIDKVNYIVGDFFDDEVLERTVSDMDLIYHAICTVNPGNSNNRFIMGYERDLIQSIKLCTFAKNNNTKIVFLSSGGTVYGVQRKFPIAESALPVPINHYGNLKLCIENVMHVFNVQNKTNFVVARIANPYGPGQDYTKGVGFIDAVLKHIQADETIKVFGNGKVIRDYIYIEDVCKVLAFIGLNSVPYEIINVSSGVGVSQNEIIELVKKRFGDIKVEYIAARTVDVEKMILSNKRLVSFYREKMVNLETGIELYREYLEGNGIL